MTVWIHSYNLLLVAPLWEGTDLRRGLSVGEIRLVSNIEVLAGDGERVVNGV